MVEAVHVLHSLNIAHRDIKPENVLLGGDDLSTAKLSDLAFADFDRYNLRTECGTLCERGSCFSLRSAMP